RGVPSTDQPLLNTGMTRDGLFLIENGEIVGPVQNFRWNMSPLVAYNNLTLVGSPVPMLLGESFDSSNAALVPPVRIEEFYMTSISPAVCCRQFSSVQSSSSRTACCRAAVRTGSRYEYLTSRLSQDGRQRRWCHC